MPHEDTVGTLRSQALATLEKLLQVDRNMWQEAVDYLTGPIFCWVLVSDAQPHMYLLRALRKTAPKEVVTRIVHARLSQVTVQRHIDALIPRRYDTSTVTPSPHIVQLGPQTIEYGYRRARKMVTSEVGYAMIILPHVLPSLQRLDITLDVADYERTSCRM
ncbi:hypothetical protein CC86DRAFT_401601 [Ophiobolus disseminans]|uniref:Uncharacterized protein n=1 Tax=Ophiobolus disseminans TaxID=1469910 RepID=A0A6A7ACQ2_9PLEO|nr:hypothetical protein CC86DRAFT_401601 [Ophiobolus disseminans]